MNTVLLGRWGEATAAEYLRKKKYRIIDVNFKTRFGEIDIIAEKKKCLAFVEVKLRKNNEYGDAAEFVTKKKQEKLRITAEIWLSKNEVKAKEMQFDVIEIYAPDGVSENYTINHIENAF